jgi:tRNA (guanine10-N2)-methyltransferase
MGQKYRRQDQTIRNNLKQYGLDDKFIDILVADFSTKYMKDCFKFDIIITDPPYGIRFTLNLNN